MRAQLDPLLLAVLLRRRPRRADRLLQLPDGLHAGALDPERLGLADRDRQHRLRRTDPDAPGAQRRPEQRTRAQPRPEPGEVLGSALPEVQDLAGVVVEVIAQRGESIPLPERVEPFADREIQPPRTRAAQARRCSQASASGSPPRNHVSSSARVSGRSSSGGAA